MNRIYFTLIISSVFLLLTFSAKAQINVFPWEETFDTSIIPSEWTQEFISGTANWEASVGGNYSHPPLAFSGDRNVLFASSNYDGDETILVSPEFDFSEIANPRVSFYHAQYNWDTDQDQLIVMYRIGADGSWTTIEEYNTAINGWTNKSLEIPVAGNSVYIGFKAISGYGYGVVLDEVIVDDAPDCPIVENLAVVNTTTESITLYWESDATLWQIQYGESGFELGEGTNINSIINHQYTITSLDESSNYDCYVRSVCSGNNSEWVGPLEVTTGCFPLEVTNYFEGFEGEEAPPACWQMVYSNPNPAPANMAALTTTAAFEGNKSFRFSSYAAGPPYDQYLISPEIQDYSETREFRFWYKRFNSGSETFRIGYSVSGNNLTTDFDWTDPIYNSTSEWQLYSMEIPSGVKYVTIHYMTVFQYYLYIDNLQIRIPPECPQPENLVVDNVSAISAHATWVAVGEEEEWTISYGLNGFVPMDGTMINTENTVYVMNDLIPNTNYQVYVKANCSEETSSWTGPVDFTTPYGCPQVSNIFTTSITAETAEIAWMPAGDEVSWNIEYGPTGFIQSTGTTVSDISNPEILLETLNTNSEYDIYIQAHCGSLFGNSLWSEPFSFTTLPCNDGCMYQFEMTDSWGDGWGDNIIEIYQNGELTTSFNLTGGSFGIENLYLCQDALVSLVITPTTYASEIGVNLISPFGVTIYSLEQGTLPNDGPQQTLTTFTASCLEPLCYPPTDIVIDNITYSGAKVSFNPPDENESFDISYGGEDFDPDEGTIISGIEEYYYTLTSLLAETYYEVYVRTTCSSGISNWTGPYGFTTTAAEIDNPSECGLNISIPDDDCVVLSIDVNDVPYTSLGMDVVVDQVRFIINHEFNDDIDMYLTSPSGESVLLLSDVGDDSDGFGISNGSCDEYTSLSMSGIDGNINSGTHPFTGIYTPEGDFNDLYDGANPNGYWMLEVCDDAAFFTGSLEFVELVFAPQKYLMWSDGTFIEAPANDGSIDTEIQLELFNETFSTTGELTLGDEFIVTNISSGLNVVITVNTETTATITIQGNAIQHANIDDVTDLSIEFTNSAFTENNASEIINYFQSGILIDFKNLSDISNVSPLGNPTYVCEADLDNQFIEYDFVNTGEIAIPVGSNIHIKVHNPPGTEVLHEVLILGMDMNPGDEISGITSSSINFGELGEHPFNLIIQGPADILPVNDTAHGQIFGVSQEMEFWGSENDTLIADMYPAIVSVSAIILPESEIDYTYYWQNGISTSNSIDVVSDGWYSCTIITEACSITDSVFVYIHTGLQTSMQNDEYLLLYPNPANDIVNIKFKQIPQEDVIIRIRAINGQVIEEIFVSNLQTEYITQYDVGNLPEGMYFVETICAGYHYLQKLILYR